MKQRTKTKDRWKGLLYSLTRFPLTIIMIVIAALLNAITMGLTLDESIINLSVTLLIGAFLSAVFQMLHERFFRLQTIRILFMGITIAFSIAYFILIRNTQWGVEVTIRTAVLLFLLLIAFIWIPVIKSRIEFNGSFLAVFKSFFIAIFFTGVLFLGVTLIIATTNMLIFTVDDQAYAQAANFIFVLMAPIYFLSMIPTYPNNDNMELPSYQNADDNRKLTVDQMIPAEASEEDGKRNREEVLVKLTTPNKFLESLISYVIIPITAVFTIILLLYIIMNITGDFWTDNLLEPMLVTYSITVIIVYLLASSIHNALTKYFRLIFPKILVAVVLFQTLSSILRISDLGITYGRYYVILFGLFAIVAGILFSALPVRKNGMIAPVLIIISLISIIPPIDAFTISRRNQMNRLENILRKNNMFDEDTITPNGDVSEKDREIIVSSVRYLDEMEYTKDIDWLSDYSRFYDFENTFGFSRYETSKEEFRSVYLDRNVRSPIAVNGYDFIVRMQINDQSQDVESDSFEVDGKVYRIRLVNNAEKEQAILLEQDKNTIISYQISDIFSRFQNYTSRATMETEEATFTQDNEAATLTIIADSISMNEWVNDKSYYAEVYLLVKIK